MGYAATVSYSLNNFPATAGYQALLTTVATNITIGSLTTPDYKGTPTYAYADLIVPFRYEDSGVNNSFDATSNGYIGLNPGATFNCGAIPSGALWTMANGTGGAWRVYGRTNIAALIRPNTAYTCQIMFARSQGDNLVLINPQIELKLYFNV
jgi:hypothetical protein